MGTGAQRSLIGALGSIEAAKERAAATGRANDPAGYRFNMSGGLEAISGGPADKKIESPQSSNFMSELWIVH